MRCAGFQIKQKTDYYDFRFYLSLSRNICNMCMAIFAIFRNGSLSKNYSHLSRYSEDEDWAQDRLDLYCR